METGVTEIIIKGGIFVCYCFWLTVICLVITLNSRKMKEVYKIDSMIVYLFLYVTNVITSFFIFEVFNYHFILVLSSCLMMFTIHYFSKLTIIGLTGGIACGKSTLSKFMKEQLKLPVIDTDILAREIVEPGKFAYRRIVHSFGTEILQEDGTLNRPKLGEIIFKDKRKRLLLNLITHPSINLLMFKKIFQEYRKGNHHIVIEVPLLFESKFLPILCYPTIVVYLTEESIQKSRLMQRNGFTEEVAQKRISSQMPLKSKVKMCHIPLCNDTSEESMKTELMEKLPFYFSF